MSKPTPPAASFASLPLRPPSGEARPIGELWAAGPTIFVFLRHFG